MVEIEAKRQSEVSNYCSGIGPGGGWVTSIPWTARRCSLNKMSNSFRDAASFGINLSVPGASCGAMTAGPARVSVSHEA